MWTGSSSRRRAPAPGDARFGGGAGPERAVRPEAPAQADAAVEGFRALLALGGLSDEATDHVVAMVGPEGALLDALKTIDDQL